MEIDIVKIGNSQGLRLPKAILEQCGFTLDKPVQLEVDGNRLIISPLFSIREHWEDSFKEMALAGDDISLLDETMVNAFDENEWAW